MKSCLNARDNGESLLCYAMLIPLAMLVASLVAGGFSYNAAKQKLTDDLNDAMVAFAKDNRELWTRQDTITALRHMHEATNRQVAYRASDINFSNAVLREEAYFTIAVVDDMTSAPKSGANVIASDSIILVPERSVDGLAVQIRGFAHCSMASVFAVSDQTFPGVLLTLSFLSFSGLHIWRRKRARLAMPMLSAPQSPPAIESVRLTPMQRRFTQLLLDAHDMKVDKAALCAALWGNKSNAEESLYTLVRRTKKALAQTNIEIICNRGDSYELRITD